ncbi:MAG: hypothetical protein E7644_07410 [Ruminococcaceae bacterium]|nr:hypothetical protein [Oscillospiraceae bacterium]
MPDDRVKRPYWTALQITAIVLLLAFLVGILVSERRRTAADLTLVRAETVTVEERISAVGYVFRAETVLETDRAGAVRYARADGDAVAAGELLFTAFEGDADARAVGEILAAELELWRRLAAAERPWQEAYFEAYEALMAICTANGAENRVIEAEALLAALQRQEADAEMIRVRIVSLEQEFDALVADANGSTESRAPADGLFYRNVDGLEEVLTPAALTGLTPAGLQELLNAPRGDANAAGKLAAGGATLAVAVKETVAESFIVGNIYPLLLDGAKVPLLLPLLDCSAADANGDMLLSFSLPVAYATTRRISVSLPGESHTGLRVPMAAVESEGEELFVYVAMNGKAERRRLSTVLYRDGYCLAAATGEMGYLAEGENIVLTARRLYEGKALK